MVIHHFSKIIFLKQSFSKQIPSSYSCFHQKPSNNQKKSKQSLASNLNIRFTGSHPSLGVLPQRGDYIHYIDAYVFPMFPIHHQRLTTEAWRLIRWKPTSWRWPSSTVIISPPSCNGRWVYRRSWFLEVLGLGWFIDDLWFFLETRNGLGFVGTSFRDGKKSNWV